MNRNYYGQGNYQNYFYEQAPNFGGPPPFAGQNFVRHQLQNNDIPCNRSTRPSRNNHNVNNIDTNSNGNANNNNNNFLPPSFGSNQLRFPFQSPTFRPTSQSQIVMPMHSFSPEGEAQENYFQHTNNTIHPRSNKNGMQHQPVNNFWSNASSQPINSNQTFNQNRSNLNGTNGRQFYKGQRMNNQNRQKTNGSQNDIKPNFDPKKVKVDKRDLAENNVYYCDVCDRGFKTNEVYIEHVSNHQQCKYEGCPYVASPKLVVLHYKVQHTNGIAKKIWSLETKEDIQNWIKTRKSNYPTAANIAKKKQLQEDREARGEVLETKQFGKMNRKARVKQNNRNMKRTLDEKEDNSIANKKPKTDTTEKEPKSHQICLALLPTVSEPMSLISQASSPGVCEPMSLLSENQISNNNTSSASANTTSSSSIGLTSILSCYGDDSDCDTSDNEEDNLENSSNKHTVIKQHPSPVKMEDNSTSDINADVDIEINEKQTQEMDTNNNNNRKKNKGRKKNNLQNGDINNKIHKKQSLLEMLLAKEIRHERNIVLQCVHYIVQKNYFQNDTILCTNKQHK